MGTISNLNFISGLNVSIVATNVNGQANVQISAALTGALTNLSSFPWTNQTQILVGPPGGPYDWSVDSSGSMYSKYGNASETWSLTYSSSPPGVYTTYSSDMSLVWNGYTLYTDNFGRLSLIGGGGCGITMSGTGCSFPGAVSLGTIGGWPGDAFCVDQITHTITTIAGVSNILNGVTFANGGMLGPWLNARAGVVSVSALSTSQTVTFSTVLPSTSYSVTITPEFSLGAIAAYVDTKTVSGFTIEFSAGVAGGNVDWHAILNQ